MLPRFCLFRSVLSARSLECRHVYIVATETHRIARGQSSLSSSSTQSQSSNLCSVRLDVECTVSRCRWSTFERASESGQRSAGSLGFADVGSSWPRPALLSPQIRLRRGRPSTSKAPCVVKRRPSQFLRPPVLLVLFSSSWIIPLILPLLAYPASVPPSHKRFRQTF